MLNTGSESGRRAWWQPCRQPRCRKGHVVASCSTLLVCRVVNRLCSRRVMQVTRDQHVLTWLVPWSRACCGCDAEERYGQRLKWPLALNPRLRHSHRLPTSCRVTRMQQSWVQRREQGSKCWLGWICAVGPAAGDTRMRAARGLRMRAAGRAQMISCSHPSCASQPHECHCCKEAMPQAAAADAVQEQAQTLLGQHVSCSRACWHGHAREGRGQGLNELLPSPLICVTAAAGLAAGHWL